MHGAHSTYFSSARARSHSGATPATRVSHPPVAGSSNDKSPSPWSSAPAHRAAAAVGGSQLDSSSLALQVEGDRALLADLGLMETCRSARSVSSTSLSGSSTCVPTDASMSAVTSSVVRKNRTLYPEPQRRGPPRRCDPGRADRRVGDRQALRASSRSRPLRRTHLLQPTRDRPSRLPLDDLAPSRHFPADTIASGTRYTRSPQHALVSR